jgi:chromosome segregation ATPase
MIEPIMFAGIGFLVAGLFVIGAIPLVHARAVRLTQKRIEALTPLSISEIQADKDQLRAEFAMSTRRLEMNVEQMKGKAATQLAEIGRLTEAVGRLKLELADKVAALAAFEESERTLSDELAGTQEALAAKSQALEAAESMSAETLAELARITTGFGETNVTVQSQRVELVSVRAQFETVKEQGARYERQTKEQLAGYERDNMELRQLLESQTADLSSTRSELVEERLRSEQLGTRIADLERQLVASATDAEISGRRVQELATRLDEQGRSLAQRESVANQLRTQADTSRQTEADVRTELAATEKRYRIATELMHAEKALTEEQLRQSQEERSKLHDDMAAMKQEVEATRAAERMENAVLRERINDVAVEIARLTSALEGPGSAIDTILSSDPSRTHGANGGGDKLGAITNGNGTLADRIRALQSRAARLPQAS